MPVQTVSPKRAPQRSPPPTPAAPPKSSGPGSLAERIRSELARSAAASPCTLAQRLGRSAEAISAECERMVRRRELTVLRPSDLEILRTLRTHSEPLGTGEIGRSVDVPSPYSRCRRLQDLGLLASERRKSERRLYFSPVTGQVLTNTTYPRIKEVLDDLMAIARREPVPRGAEIPPGVKERLREKYRSYLRSLAATATPEEREQLRRFERELMAVLGNTKRSDVTGLVGLRPFHPWVRFWSLERPDWVEELLAVLRGMDRPMGYLEGSIYLYREPPPRPARSEPERDEPQSGQARAETARPPGEDLQKSA